MPAWCQRWKALWTARTRLALWASSGLGSLILYVVCCKGWDTGLHTRGAGENVGHLFSTQAVLQSEWSGLYQKMAAPHLPAFLSPSYLFLQLLSIIYRVRACWRPCSQCSPVGARGDSCVFCLLCLIQITSSCSGLACAFWPSSASSSTKLSATLINIARPLFASKFPVIAVKLSAFSTELLPTSHTPSLTARGWVEGQVPDPSSLVVISSLNWSQAALLVVFFFHVLKAVPFDSSHFFLFSFLTAFLIHVDHLRWAGSVCKNKGFSDLFPLCPLFIPKNTYMRLHPGIPAWHKGVRRRGYHSTLPPSLILKFLPIHQHICFLKKRAKGKRKHVEGQGCNSIMWF